MYRLTIALRSAMKPWSWPQSSMVLPLLTAFILQIISFLSSEAGPNLVPAYKL